MKAITTTYFGPGNVKGSRIIAKDLDNNRVIMSYCHDQSMEDNHAQAARRLCEKMHWEGKLIGGHVKAGMVWVWADNQYRVTVLKTPEVVS